ncbi:MAG: LemA family protein [Acidimicrobiales bacterium]
MTTALAVLGVVVTIVVVVPIVSYNRFVAQRQQIASAWATIDAELVRRHHLVPQLVDSVHGAAAHERAVLVHLAEAEARAHALRTDPASLVPAEQQVREAVAQVVALRESSPQLNSNANFVALQGQLSMIEDRIAAARRFYNTRVVAHNERIDAFPSNLVARNRGYTKAAYFGDA